MRFSEPKMCIRGIGVHDAIRSFGEGQSPARNSIGECNKNCIRLGKLAAIANIDFPPEFHIDCVISASSKASRADNCSFIDRNLDCIVVMRRNHVADR
jgi:hypothetical protein